MPPRQVRHEPVLPEELVAAVSPATGNTILDATLGGGGHTRRLAEAVGPTGCVIALDRDPAALEAAESHLRGLPVVLVHSDFRDVKAVLTQLGISRIDGMIADLGLSSDQLDDEERGFSFASSGPLDLRFDPTSGAPASRIVNQFSADALADIIYQFGEERHSRRIARAIVDRRREREFQTSEDLAAVVRSVTPRGPRGSIDPATRTFQALRIAVNDELGSLDALLRDTPDVLRPGGRLAVISFHSLEDRRVKEAFRDDPRYEVITRKPVRPSAEEVERNPRARSAKMRVAARNPDN